MLDAGLVCKSKPYVKWQQEGTNINFYRYKINLKLATQLISINYTEFRIRVNQKFFFV